MPPKDNNYTTGHLYVEEFWREVMKERINSVYGKPKTQIPEIVDVIFNEPATIVFWADGTKTVVKAQDEAFDPEKGLAMAISKKALGNQGNFNNEFKKWIEPYERKQILEFVNMDNKIFPVAGSMTTAQAAAKLGEACTEIGRCLIRTLNNDLKNCSRFMSKPEE